MELQQPTRRVLLKVLLCISFGALCGLILLTVKVSRLTSYFSEDPATCMNCHVMAPQYATWSHSSHRENATCVDCHVPHDNILAYYAFKANDGLKHSTVFTMRTEPQAIRISDEGVEAVQSNCKRCHTKTFQEQHLYRAYYQNPENTAEEERLCWSCHRETPHGKVRSLSSTPYAKVPTTGSMVPKWLKKLTK